jgi:hypothetical protein
MSVNSGFFMRPILHTRCILWFFNVLGHVLELTLTSTHILPPVHDFTLHYGFCTPELVDI